MQSQTVIKYLDESILRVVNIFLHKKIGKHLPRMLGSTFLVFASLFIKYLLRIQKKTQSKPNHLNHKPFFWMKPLFLDLVLKAAVYLSRINLLPPPGNLMLITILNTNFTHQTHAVLSSFFFFKTLDHLSGLFNPGKHLLTFPNPKEKSHPLLTL